MYEFKPWVPSCWESPDYMKPNPEAEPGNFITAAQMALNKISSPTEKIDGIYVAGRDLRKIKHVMPSPVDYDRLSEIFYDEWGPTIIIISPNNDEYMSVWASKHGSTYGVKKYSDFRQDDIEPYMLPLYIAECTGMELTDAQFMAHLQFIGQENGMEIYLTGSASGRGEISGAVKTDYTDIDLLIVTDLDKAEAERIITEIAEQHFGLLTREPMIVNDWQNNRQIEGVFLYGTTGNKKVQLHIGQAMEEINFRPSNFDRNYYHRVC
jgi:hypothetical protein